jgi:hypothetical protein
VARVSNVQEFLRELRHDADWIADVDAPRKLAALTLEVAEVAAALAPRAGSLDDLPHGRKPGELAAAWSAGQALRLKKSERGIEASRAALAAPSLDKPWFVYNPDFIAGFHEYGTEKMGATPMLGPALQRVASRSVA